MAAHNPERFSHSFTGRQNRQTLLPTSDPTIPSIELSEPWPGQHGSNAAPNKRWTNAFDTEIRASRMSVLVDDTLLPRNPDTNHQHEQWMGIRKAKRQTWLGFGTPSEVPHVWGGGREAIRSSWAGKASVTMAGSYDDEIVLLKEKEQLSVQWDENDIENPLNFGKMRKWSNAMILALACFMVSIASSGFSQGTRDLKTDFNVGQPVALMTTSAFVLGFAVGALVLSPMSEVYGRRELYISTFGAFVLATGALVFSSSMTTVIGLRFLGGLAGSFTQAVAPAVVADMFDAQERGLVLSIFTLAGLMGQNLGPIIAGFLDAYHGWRSIVVFVTAVSLPLWTVLAITFPETYAPVLLQRRADKLTKTTGKQHFVAGATPKPITTQLRVGALRPWIMLIYEPIVTLISLFLSVVHGTLFLLFAAYPIVFQNVRGWRQGVASLPFLALVIGIILSLFYVAVIDQRRYARVLVRNNGIAPPEARLPPAILGSAILPIGLFWFALSNGPETFWLVSVSAGVFFGFGMVLLYMSLTNYLVDSYLAYSASALAASTVLRSCAGAAFPLFTHDLYDKLGIHWASSIPGFMALVFVPCLVGFYKWGHVLRTKTRFGQEAAALAAQSQN